MATLEHDFRKQDTYLTKDWYKKVLLILTKRGAIDGVTSNALPQFLKGVTTIISLEVCYGFYSLKLISILHLVEEIPLFIISSLIITEKKPSSLYYVKLIHFSIYLELKTDRLIG